MDTTKHPPQTTIRNGIDVTTIPPDKIRPLTSRQIVAAAQKDLDTKGKSKKTAPPVKAEPEEVTEEVPEELEE